MFIRSVQVRTVELAGVNQDLLKLQKEGQEKEKELNKLQNQLKDAEQVNLEKTISLQALQAELAGTDK